MPTVRVDNELIPPSDDPGEPVINTASIEGYADQMSYYPGEEVQLKVSCHEDSIMSFSLYRFGAQQEVLLREDAIPVQRQDYFKYSYSFGCDWATTYAFELPNDLTSGLYAAVVKNQAGNTDYITFVVKASPTAPRSPILVVASTNTWQAYNNWSGASFYRYNLGDLDSEGDGIRHSVIVSFNRPNKVDSPFGEKGHLVNAEVYLLAWLENNGIAYELISDEELHNDATILDDRKAVILHAHPEYYTSEMLDRLESYNLAGGNIMYLGANGLYWKVGLSDDRQIECRKDGDSHRFAEGSGGLWSEKDRSPAKLIGSHYSSTGYGTYFPYQTKDQNHWVFEGTGITNDALFGTVSLNGGAASGHETDKRTSDTPSDFHLLAKGTNPDNGGAELLIRESAGRGLVFSVGSITYTGALSVDSTIHRITLNVLNRCLEE